MISSLGFARPSTFARFQIPAVYLDGNGLHNHIHGNHYSHASLLPNQNALDSPERPGHTNAIANRQVRVWLCPTARKGAM